MCAEQFRNGRRQDHRIGAGHAAHLQGFIAVHDQQLHRATATQLQCQTAGLLQLAGDQRGDGCRFAQQLGDCRLIIAAGLHGLPGGLEAHDGTTNIESFKQETLHVAAAHLNCSA